MRGKWDASKREALKQRSAKRDTANRETGSPHAGNRGAGRPEGHRARQHEPADEADGPILIWGVHAVAAALNNPARPIVKLTATDNAALRLAEPIATRGIEPEPTTPRDLDQRLGPDTVHQGVLLEVGPLPDHEPAALAETALARGPLVVLDQVTDPHNVGAILRSAAVFGSAGIVMTRRHSPPLAGALAKAASGALDLVPVALVQNLARTLGELKAAGVVLVGLDGDAEGLLDEALLGDAGSEPLTGRAMALVLGAEGRGLRQLTAETCNRLCRIGSDGQLASLNVSNAAAIALHLAAMARRGRRTG